MQGLFSNAMVSKMVQKRMQGKAGLGTKMVLPRKCMQVSPLCGLFSHCCDGYMLLWHHIEECHPLSQLSGTQKHLY